MNSESLNPSPQIRVLNSESPNPSSRAPPKAGGRGEAPAASKHDRRERHGGAARGSGEGERRGRAERESDDERRTGPPPASVNGVRYAGPKTNQSKVWAPRGSFGLKRNFGNKESLGSKETLETKTLEIGKLWAQKKLWKQIQSLGSKGLPKTTSHGPS